MVFAFSVSWQQEGQSACKKICVGSAGDNDITVFREIRNSEIFNFHECIDLS